MKIETTSPETLSTAAIEYSEIAAGVYLSDDGKIMVLDANSLDAVLIDRGAE